jgi:hypothetical protein
MRDVSGRETSGDGENFDNNTAFVLDIGFFSTIIFYIWYEDGELRPSLVRSQASPLPRRPLGGRGR